MSKLKKSYVSLDQDIDIYRWAKNIRHLYEGFNERVLFLDRKLKAEKEIVNNKVHEEFIKIEKKMRSLGKIPDTDKKPNLYFDQELEMIVYDPNKGESSESFFKGLFS